MTISPETKQLITAAATAIALAIHYLLTNRKLNDIHISTNGNVIALVNDLKDAVTQIATLKAELKAAKEQSDPQK